MTGEKRGQTPALRQSVRGILNGFVKCLEVPAFSVLGSAVILTIVGDSFLQIVSFGVQSWSPLYWLWRIAVLLALIYGVWKLGPRLERKFRAFLDRTPKQMDRSLTVKDAGNIHPTSALIVMVSITEDGSAQRAVRRFLEADPPVLRYVYLVHSPGSRGVALKLEAEIQRRNKDIKVFRDMLKADFYDLKAMFDVCETAITHAIGQTGSGTSVVIEITGGPGIASAGAVLAQAGHSVIMSYMPYENNRPGSTMRRVDSSWVTKYISNPVSKSDEAA